MQEELWKPIVGFEGLYEVSNLGRVRSLDRAVLCKDFFITKKGKLKTIMIDKKGYQYVFLSKEGVERIYRVHRLVAITFIPNPENKPEIDHINTIKTDNRIENLRWVTSKENAQNAISHKKQRDAWTEQLKQLVKQRKIERGAKNAPRKVFQYTLDGQFVAEYESIKNARIALGPYNISMALDKEDRSAGGYIWRSKREEKPVYQGRMRFFRLLNILQFDKDGNCIAEYKDVNDAAKATGLHPENIRRSIYNDYKPRKYKFKLKGDL